MKTQVVRTSIVALLAVAASYAQSVPMRANISFGFVAGGATFPAGEYEVDQQVRGMIIVRPEQGKATGIILNTVPVSTGAISATSKLVFQRYGNVLMLSEVWTRGNETGRATRHPGRYRELAASNRSPQTVVVNAD